MKVKSVVKVMNFHSLLRVDKSRKTADKYRDMEKELTRMISVILNNRNFLLDKKITKPDLSKPVLEIYVGSDLGFCGSINSNVAKRFKENKDSVKVVIGKKLNSKVHEDCLLNISREEFVDYKPQIRKLLKDAIINKQYSSVVVYYNHYHNISKIEFCKKVLYPLDIDLEQKSKEYNDYTLESDNDNLLESIILQYLEYELEIVWINAFASENITRQSTTQDSLKKIEEIEEEELRVERKEQKMKSFRKVLDSFVNQKGGNAK